MGNHKIALLIIILLNLGTLLASLACDSPRVPAPPVANNPPQPEPTVTCPRNALRLTGCVDLLEGLIHVHIGSKAKAKCCPLLGGLVGLEAAVCFCNTIRLRVLDINVVLPVALRVIRACGKTPPPNFKCPPPPPPPLPVAAVRDMIGSSSVVGGEEKTGYRSLSKCDVMYF